MKKDKIEHFKTLQDDLFTHFVPDGKTSGETDQVDGLEGVITHDPKELLDKVWAWIGETDVK